MQVVSSGGCRMGPMQRPQGVASAQCSPGNRNQGARNATPSGLPPGEGTFWDIDNKVLCSIKKVRSSHCRRTSASAQCPGPSAQGRVPRASLRPCAAQKHRAIREDPAQDGFTRSAAIAQSRAYDGPDHEEAPCIESAKCRAAGRRECDLRPATDRKRKSPARD